MTNQSNDNYEIIVVDDHSQDKTSEIISELSQSYSKIQYFLSNGQGVSAARNYGISKAIGDYLIFVDADDRLENDAIENLEKFIKSCALPEVIFCGYTRVTEKNEIIKPYSYKYKDGYGQDVLSSYLNKQSYTHLGAFCFNKNYIETNNLSFQNFDYAEDIVFVSQALFFAKYVVSLKKETYRWTLRQGSVLYSNTLNKFNSLKALEYLYGFLQEKECKNFEIYNALGNHYAMLLLDTVTSLLWMGRTVNEILESIKTNVNWSVIPTFFKQSNKVRRDLFFLKHSCLWYLIYCKKHYVPYNFRKKGIKKYDG